MAVAYNVVFEKVNNSYRIAGVAKSDKEMGKMVGSVSSKGTEYTAISIKYSCNTELNDDFFVVYTRDLRNKKNDGNTFYTMALLKGEKEPSVNDIFLYKTEKSANDRVNKINSEVSKNREAVVVKINLNTVYLY